MITEQYPVSAEYTPDGWESPGLSFEDYTRCHTERHVGRDSAWNPEFANNSKQLQHVLMVRAWQYVHTCEPFPKNASWEELNKDATAKALRGHEIHPSAPPKQFAMRDAHIAAVKRAGGYLELQGAIAYRCWLLNQDSITVGDSLGITPTNVRATLQRLREIARKLGFPVGKPGHTRGIKKCRPQPNRVEPPTVEPVPVEPGSPAHETYIGFCRRVGAQPMTFTHWQMLAPQYTPRPLRAHQAACV